MMCQRAEPSTSSRSSPKGDLKRELYTFMPSLQGGWSEEVTSYMELVNWLLHEYADE